MERLRDFYERLDELDANIKRVEEDLCYLEVNNSKNSISYEAKNKYLTQITAQRDNLR